MKWGSLRSVGNLYVLKVSYAVLVLVPLLSKHDNVITFLGMSSCWLAILFTASFSLAVANLVYDIRCPVIIKRFASPNDLYEKMLQIKALSESLYPRDDFKADLTHCKGAYREASGSRCFARYWCTFFFITSSLFFAIIFIYRAYVVYGSCFSAPPSL